MRRRLLAVRRGNVQRDEAAGEEGAPPTRAGYAAAAAHKGRARIRTARARCLASFLTYNTLPLPILPLTLLLRRKGQTPTPSPTCERRRNDDGPSPQCALRGAERGVKHGIRRGAIHGTKEEANTAATSHAPVIPVATGQYPMPSPTCRRVGEVPALLQCAPGGAERGVKRGIILGS